MRNTEESILKVFQSNPTKELSTEFLARTLYPKEYSDIDRLFQNNDKPSIHDARNQKFQLHRKLLYYLNKLTESNVVRVAKIAEKGEKYFALNVVEGETIIEKGYKKILITKPQINTTYIEKYESCEVMKKFDEESWVTRFNSIILECPKNREVQVLYKIISECILYVNDVIALNEFENIINTTSEKNIKEFIDKIHKDSESLGKQITLIINLQQVSNNIIPFIEYFSRINPKNISIVFNVSNKNLNKQSKALSTIIEKFSESKIKINFKNNDLNNAPYFKGRAGIYSFDEQEWNTYLKKIKGTTIGASCSQSQIAININKFFENYKTDSEFREAAICAAKTLLQANTVQRRKVNEYYKNINQLNAPNTANFYKFSRNYIRFWNYDWHKDIKENNNLFELLKSTKEVVDNFCHSEETIYRSCGIPIRFKIAFSSAFRNFDQKFMGERDYKKMNVKKAQDYYDGEIKDFIQAREKMFEIFDGGDRLRIFRSSEFDASEIIREISIMLNTYRIPFFTYDFSGLRGVVKLTNFI
jgi:hypothetical protein